MKKYNLTLAAIFKNEARFIREWIEYHRLVGVEHFYLYNNESTDQSREVLEPYVQKGIVTLTDWPDRPGQVADYAKYRWVYNVQIPAYEHAIARNEAKWIALLDCDEFLVPKTSDTMLPLLEQYDMFPAIRLYWEVFGTSGIQELQPDQLVTETFHKTCLPEDDFSTKFFKSIVKPEEYVKAFWPTHINVYKNDEPDIVVGKYEAQVNHYIIRSVKFFYEAKLKNRQKAMNEGMTESDIQHFLSVGNAREDEEKAIRRFLPALKQALATQTPS